MASRSTPSPTGKLKQGDEVTWNTSQGTTEGTITRKVTGTAYVKGDAGGHTAKASKAEPQYEVESAKTGKKAIHKPGALHKK
ncbi:MAG: DUF2945 domain-containing protein [Pseudomonadota bacterium]|nr:DUF2945 domain-containing protein [Pseudomonadota bacterium]